MHDTASLLGKLFIELYCNEPDSVVVEIGSSDVNGSLRPSIKDERLYVGLDISAGEGVDVVVEQGAKLPIRDAVATGVIASSVFEHDSEFWNTFLEMCRIVQPGGFIYVNAPSNGMFHQYPLDCWRFYPDAGHALERLSKRGNTPVILVESFIAERQTDQWNDFVGVFYRIKEAGEKPPVNRKLYESIDCKNIYDFQKKEIAKFEEYTEDARIIKSSKENCEDKTRLSKEQATQIIDALYQCLVMRDPDQKGREDFVHLLRNCGMTQVLKLMLSSAELKSKYDVFTAAYGLGVNGQNE